MNNQSFAYIYDIGGDLKGIAGSIYGGIINQYIITQKSEAEIRSQRLIRGSPYLGLEQFELQDKDKFFGREQWINKLSKDLDKTNLLLLQGASGSGKSSLVQAGLIPHLLDEWGTSKVFKLIFVPDRNPFESLYDKLPRKYKEVAAKIFDQKKHDLLVKLVKILKEDNPKLIIFIDQFEELFRLTPKQKGDEFIACLVQLIEQQYNSVKLIIAIRTDFLDHLGEDYSDLRELIEDSKIRHLTAMDDLELRLAIAEPAARNGVTFEKGLVEQIISDFRNQAGSLPLLEYTLDLLWETDGISENNKILNITTYRDLGGVSGALQQQANKIYEKFNDQEKEAVNRIFFELIDYHPPRKPASRRTEKNQFEKNSVIKSVLNQLIENRLLVSGRYKSTVEVAHEQLLCSWKVLQDLIHEKEEIIILRSRLISDAKQWNDLRNRDEEKAKDELWSGSKLTRVLEFIDKQVYSSLDKESDQFIQASVAWRDRQKIEQEIQHNVELASHRLLEGRNFDALIFSLRAGVLLKKLSTVKADNLKVLDVLQQAVYGMKEYNRLEADNGDVIAVSFSPDGRLIALGTRNNTIKLWKNDGCLKTLGTHLGDVESVAISPNGKLIASASRDNTVKLWNIDGTLRKTLEGHEYPVESVAISPNGKLIASASSDHTIKLWSIDGTLQKTCQGHTAEVIGVCFSPDSKLIASASRDRTVKIWSIDGICQKTLKGHKDAVYGVVFSPDSKLIASASWDRTVKIWSIDGICQKTLKGHDRPVESVAFSPDGQTIATGSKDKMVKLWKLEEISPKTLEDHKDEVYEVVFSPDGQTIVTAGKDGTVKLWAIDGICRKTIEAHKGSVLSACFSPDGQTIVTAGKDGTVKLWGIDGTLQISFKGHDKPIESVAFSPDGQTIVTGSRDKTVKIWRCDGSLLNILNHLDQHKDEVKAVNFSPDGELIATASRDRTVKLWKRDGTYLTTLKGHKDSVRSVCFSPDSQTIASASCDNLVKLWSLDGTSLGDLRDHKEWVYSVVFSPDGELIATASSDKTVKLWKRDGTYLTTLKGHSKTVLSVAFSPDGKIVASAGRDKKVILWNLDIDDLLVHGCNWLRDYLKTNLNVSESDRHLCDSILDMVYIPGGSRLNPQEPKFQNFREQLPKTINTYQFELITFNSKGKEIKQEPKEAKYYTEDLGNGVTLDMVYIPGGSFMMGTEDEEIERLVKKYDWEVFRLEKPQHQVTVKPFFIGKYPVTQAQWRAIASLPKVNHDLEPDPSYFKGDELPVEYVSWENAREFCQRLSLQTEREYRLPSEAEWEYACRAGTNTPFNFGETITGELANYYASDTYANEPQGEYREQTTPVGSFPPNAFGLYDMHGQVWEWCEDDYHDSYNGAPNNGRAWLSESSNIKVIRGGSWDDNPDACRSAYRGYDTRALRFINIGFRVACVVPRQT